MTRVVVTGAGGQLGHALLATAPPTCHVIGLDRAAMDIADESSVLAVIRAHQPDIIVNAAAFTAVDDAESRPEDAHRANADGPAILARAARECGARIVHVSTDYVFDGRAGRAYRPDDAAHPLNVYGQSKRAGELAVLQHGGAAATVVRTSWLYGRTGRNFVRTMLRRLREPGAVRVVADQIAAPTRVDTFADAVWAITRTPSVHGIVHWCDAGVASWYDLAVAVSEEARAVGLLDASADVGPVPSSAYPTRATRPAFSLLDVGDLPGRLDVTRLHWRTSLRAMLQSMPHA
ncbi:MAG: dTDP-4-dehydrorhamnose reductase [Gemmatimonadaceae bacterium]|nr:dTDP-4-dehydrorhamnose reductase [Gemmatimonadaceae bacterium]